MDITLAKVEAHNTGKRFFSGNDAGVECGAERVIREGNIDNTVRLTFEIVLENIGQSAIRTRLSICGAENMNVAMSSPEEEEVRAVFNCALVRCGSGQL